AKRTDQIQCLQQVGFALSIGAMKEPASIAKIQSQRVEIAKAIQCDRCNVHSGNSITDVFLSPSNSCHTCRKASVNACQSCAVFHHPPDTRTARLTCAAE